jgi:hypothetical protein
MSATTTTFGTGTTGTTDTTGTTAQERGSGRVTWVRGIATGLAGAVAATLVAGAFSLAGHELAVTDGPIPLFAFAQLVLLFTVVGVVIARHTSRATFFRTAVALTVLSCVPDLALGDGVVSKVGLICTHVVAAAIIVPRLARR